MQKTSNSANGLVKRRIGYFTITSAMLCLLILRLTLFPNGYDHKKSALAYIKVDCGNLIYSKFYSIGQMVDGKVITDIQKDKVVFNDKTEIVKTPDD
jgi:hypothetical protein